MKAKELLERYKAGERDFSRVDLSKENLSGAVWVGDEFGGENDYPVGGSSLRGINLSQANLARVRLDGVDLRGANLRGANLEMAFMARANLTDANLSEAILFQNSLHHALFKRTQCKKASFRQVRAGRANFCDANLEEADFFESNLVQSDFSRANLKNAKMEICILYCADFSGADMRKINLYFSRLDRVVAIEANMTQANFYRARLREANLTDANLRGSFGSELDDAILYETVMPDGSIMSNERGKTEINRIVESREDFIKRAWEIDFINQKDFRQRYEAGERDFSGFNPNLGYTRFLLDINLSRASCGGKDLTDYVFSNANLESIDMRRARFFSCKLINSNLRGANLREAKLDSASLIDVDLTDADLTGADLSYARFIGTNLTNANLTDVYMGSEFGYTDYEAVFAHTIMPDGRMRNDNLAIGAEELLRRYAEGERNFSRIILHYADLSGVELKKVNFRQAYFNHVNLSGANLIDAYFGSAKFIHCNLKKTKFEHYDGSVSSYYNYGCDFSFAYFIDVDMRQSQAAGTVTSTTFIECNFEGSNWDCSAEDIVIHHNVILASGRFIRWSDHWII